MAELAEGVEGEVALRCPNSTTYEERDCSLLPKDLLLDGPRRDEAVDEVVLFPPVAGQGLLVLFLFSSKRTSRLAPMRLRPQPPALLLRRKTNSRPCGSLNLSMSF